MTTNLVVSPYTTGAGANTFAGRAYQVEDGTTPESVRQRFFVKGSWADVRYGSIEAFTAAGLEVSKDFRPGGTAASKLQIRWSPDVIATVVELRLIGSSKGASVQPAVDLGALNMRLAASK